MAITQGFTPKTVEEQVLDALREQIVRGVLPPDEPLPLRELSASLGVSTMPVRHALRRLEAEGLVLHPPNRGAFVAPLEIEDLEEVQAIRAGIEGLATRVGVPNLERESLLLMKKKLSELRATAKSRDLDSFLTAQWNLHDVCYQAAERPRLLRLISENRVTAERYIRYALASRRGFSESLAQQVLFVEACEQGDPDRAESQVREAMAWTVSAVARALPDQR